MPEPDKPAAVVLMAPACGNIVARLTQLDAIIAAGICGLAIFTSDDAYKGHPRIQGHPNGTGTETSSA